MIANQFNQPGESDRIAGFEAIANSIYNSYQSISSFSWEVALSEKSGRFTFGGGHVRQPPSLEKHEEAPRFFNMNNNWHHFFKSSFIEQITWCIDIGPR